MAGKLVEFRRRWERRWDSLYQLQREALVIGLGLLVAAALGFGGYRVLVGPLRHWRGRQALEQAGRYMQQQDYRNALLALKRATVLMPNDPATWRVVAQNLDTLGVPETLVAHENLVQLDPGDTRQKLALVRQALRFEKADLAARTLAALPEGAAEGAEYHRLAAALALSMGRDDDYVAQLRALLAVEPQDARARFNLAVADLWRDDASARQARGEFLALLQDPAMRVRAAVELLKDAARRRDAAAAESAAKAIDDALPAPPAAAELAPGWDRLRTKLKAAAEAPEDVAVLARWLGTIGAGGDALAWLDGLPEASRRNPAVGDAAIGLAASLNDADALRRWLAAGAWGELEDADIQALARIATVRAAGRPAAERPAWLEALGATADSANGSRALARLAAIWNNREITGRALEALVRAAPRDLWARQSLEALYLGAGESGKLLELYADWRKAVPDDLHVDAAWWRLAAVLDRLPERAAEEVLSRVGAVPENPEMRLAAAAVLWRRKDFPQAATILADLSEDDRTRPEAAFWLGVVDAELGRPEAGRELRRAAESPWLPEEAAILQFARIRAER